MCRQTKIKRKNVEIKNKEKLKKLKIKCQVWMSANINSREMSGQRIKWPISRNRGIALQSW